MSKKYHARLSRIHSAVLPEAADATHTARVITIVALLGVTSYFLIRMLLPFSTPILWAVTLAIFISPLQRGLNKRIGSRNLASLLGVIITAGFVILPAIIISFQVMHELKMLFHHIRSEEAGRADAWFKSANFTSLAPWLARAGVSPEKLHQSISEGTERAINSALNYFTGFISNFAISLVYIFFTMFTLFFFLRDGRKMLNWTLHLLPMKEEQQQQLIERIRAVIRAALFGTLLVAVQHGLLIGIMFFILDIPGALIWTILMIMLAIIPVIGSVIVWCPAIIWLFITGHFIKALILLFWCSAVAGFVDHLMRPILVGRQAQLNSLAVFYGVLGGLKVFGPVGLVLGPVVVACFLILIDFILAVRDDRKDAQTEIDRRAA